MIILFYFFFADLDIIVYATSTIVVIGFEVVVGNEEVTRKRFCSRQPKVTANYKKTTFDICI